MPIYLSPLSFTPFDITLLVTSAMFPPTKEMWGRVEERISTYHYLAILRLNFLLKSSCLATVVFYLLFHLLLLTAMVVLLLKPVESLPHFQTHPLLRLLDLSLVVLVVLPLAPQNKQYSLSFFCFAPEATRSSTKRW